MADKLSNDLRVGLIGCGSMGRNHARILQSHPGLVFKGIYDRDLDLAEAVASQFPTIVHSNLESLLSSVDVVFIATPTFTHFEVAKRCLQQKKHIFVEKPIAMTYQQSQDLVATAMTEDRLICVGHVERFNPAVVWLRNRLQGTRILSINCTRVGPKPPRIKDVGIISDLAVHDIDLIAYLGKSPVTSIKAQSTIASGELEDVAEIICRSANGIVSSITTNWLTPFKSRVVQVCTTEQMFVADLITGAVSIYEGLTENTSKYIVENVIARGDEPLLAQTNEFLKWLKQGGGDTPCATGDQAAEVVRLATTCLNDTK